MPYDARILTAIGQFEVNIITRELNVNLISFNNQDEAHLSERISNVISRIDIAASKVRVILKPIERHFLTRTVQIVANRIYQNVLQLETRGRHSSSPLVTCRHRNIISAFLKAAREFLR